MFVCRFSSGIRKFSLGSPEKPEVSQRVGYVCEPCACGLGDGLGTVPVFVEQFPPFLVEFFLAHDGRIGCVVHVEVVHVEWSG